MSEQSIDVKSIFAEFIGTLLFQFLGGAAAANSSLKGEDSLGGLVTAALGNGIALAVCIYCTAKVSGGHLNPAVSTGFLASQALKDRFDMRTYLGFVIAQVVGALLGAVFLWLALPSSMLGHSNSFATLGSLSARHPMAVFLWEFLATFTLVFTVFGVVHSPSAGPTGPLAIGLSLTASVFAIGPYTGGSLNPARTLAPAIVFGVWTHIWVYLLATLLAGACAGYLYKAAFVPSDDKEYNPVS
mmetsp:Transcript_4009/g.9858  ORF Transcript_4009/g.9858 Transcript_4009/m.9858 type:complete len:243 (+) Transcript_4009:42-770(+)|eukprot:CAMPEP_0117084962 /NCGR_PEP_ID=MMETSP0472-20121206/59775_1 /TAXON_ID=693140 ORGANISM="Tiarina fusus, Strain LIS" /NCGR_SAMPLE_ID=MMETSP0472 /ASSEMBLY_ACC=CAM_ASM_000603 /LENGTH=242 /DNA_ID=CAMNT_0004814121 /DNA_START=23 /DNA_END=751 /DNA_ORIENTATION=-